MAIEHRRWEGDSLGIGLRSAHAEAREIEALLQPMEHHGWLTEEPLAHLGNDLRTWLDAHQATWRLVRTSVVQERLVVDVHWTGNGQMRSLRGDVYALIGVVAEEFSVISQHDEDGALVFDVATGQPDGQFAAHGHLLTLRVSRDTITDDRRGG